MIRKLPIVEWDFDLYEDDGYQYRMVDASIHDTVFIGEQVFCLFRKKDLEKIDSDECYDRTLAVLCNDCGIKSNSNEPVNELVGLNAGQIVPIQLNGDCNPSIDLEWIQNKCWLL